MLNNKRLRKAQQKRNAEYWYLKTKEEEVSEPKSSLNKGDKIQINWNDGLVNNGYFIKIDRGFIIYEDEKGKTKACLPSHANIKIVGEKE